MELISVGNEDTKYLINRFVLQWEVGRLWSVPDCEELVGVTHKKDAFTKDTILIKLNFEKQYFAVKLFI